MSTTGTPPAIEAWVAADRRQELDVMRAQLDPSVRLVSPLTDGFDFAGPDAVVAVFESAFELLSDIEIAGLTGRDRDWVLHGTNRLRGRNLEEIQWLHLSEAGLIDRITLFIRPAPAAIRLLALIGPALARRGALKPAAGPAARAAAPLGAVLGLVERLVMPRLGCVGAGGDHYRGRVTAAEQDALSPATLAVAAGRPARAPGAPVNPPIVLSSTYVSQGPPTPGELVYARMDTETWHPFEETLAALEGAAEPAIAFASGMAAIAAVFALVPAGGVVVLPRHAYNATTAFADELAARAGVEVRRVDIADTDAATAALDGADLLLAESPTNPMLEVADLPTLLAAARTRGVRTAVDNTFATPLGQRPLEWGADLVVHSATKYLAGHSDVVLGVVATSDADLAARLRGHRTLHGAIPGPFEVWLALRGLRTLALRVERAQATAAELARRLAGHPGVAEVRHPSLAVDPGHERAARLMRGFGSIIAVRPLGGAAAADAVVDAVRLWVPATSLGGVESCLERRRRHPGETASVPDDLLRLSVGIEDAEDLWRDLDRALRLATA